MSAGSPSADHRDAAAAVAIRPCNACPLIAVLGSAPHARPTTPQAAMEPDGSASGEAGHA